eukprot:Sspe_Gene.15000::Locus_5199_Transcript_1_1_Confidence_1.000_Length_1994::g.15000::m.15000/K13126/PABPC; polyadenylate-binding protein
MSAQTSTGAGGTGSLYVGDLKEDVTEATLFETFKDVGPIISIRVCRDAVTRRSLGYAYVNFQNPKDAERALETLNYKDVKGGTIRIMWSQRDPILRKSGAGNIFIKNLDKSIGNKELCDAFSSFGNILSCKVVTDEHGVSKGFGFVHFMTEESAKAAMESLNGNVLHGNKVFVGPFIKRAQRISGAIANFTNVYVKELRFNMDADLLKEKFSVHGEVTSTCTRKDPLTGTRVFGFVNYSEHDNAVKAIDEWHDKEVEDVSLAGKKLYVQRAMKKAEREAELRAKFMAEKARRQYPSANNLYVKNLDDTVDNRELRKHFEPYGEITSAVVMRDPFTQQTKGFGFVCFKEQEAAQKALNELNGKMIGSKPLYVNTAQRKEIRKTMLEREYAQRRMGPMMPPPMPAGFAPMFNIPYYGGQPPRGMPPPMPYNRMPGAPTTWSHPPPPAGRSSMGRGGMPPAPGRAPWPPPPPPSAPGMVLGQGMRPKAMKPTGPPMPPFGGMVPPPMKDPANDLAPLTSESLVFMTPEQQKNALGEQLYQKIYPKYPAQAAKITGMLLEMDVSETLNLLESPELLGNKIQEALAVLKDHESKQAASS